jgi:hypothetical protein
MVMMGLGRLGILAAMAFLASQAIAAADEIADPENATLDQSAYANPYFGLTYKLQDPWIPGTPGPIPSATGYYVIGDLTAGSATEVKGGMLIAAQDQFFGNKSYPDAMAMAADFRQAMAAVPGMAIDAEPSEITIGGHRFARFTYSGATLHRLFLVTALRCHYVSFVLTSRDPALVASTEVSLAGMTLPRSEDDFPRCIKDYVTPETLVTRVEPLMTLPPKTRIPVRLIIGNDGSVRHVHVIRALPEHKAAIEAALSKWRFAPFTGSDIETGVAFEGGPPRP